MKQEQTYKITMRSLACGSEEEDTITADSVQDAAIHAAEMTEDWLRDGDWGDEGARIGGAWAIYDEDGEEINSGTVWVDIEPNHPALIADAAGRYADICGTDPDDHDWTSEDVWSYGGTGIVVNAHCRKCALHRTEYSTGSQCGHGEHDTVTYRMMTNGVTQC